MDLAAQSRRRIRVAHSIPNGMNPRSLSILRVGALASSAFALSTLASASPVQNSQYAKIAVETPSVSGPFVLSATIPVRPGEFGLREGDVFKIANANGNLVRNTQVDIVERFGSSVDGASVVNVSARVQNPSPGSMAEYDVVRVAPLTINEAALPANPTMANTYLPGLGGTRQVGAATKALLGNADSLIVVAYDALGNEYRCKPLETQNARMYRAGPARSTIRNFSVMEPVGGRNPYPHLFGVHAFFTTLQRENCVMVDFRFTNGMIDQDATTGTDDKIGRVYFDRVELLVPDDSTGWTAIADVEDPFTHQSGEATGSRTIGGTSYRVYSIVRSLSDPQLTALSGTGINLSDPGKFHTIRPRGQFVRSLALAPPSETATAASYLDLEGQGFVVDDVAGAIYSNAGDRLASWWNPDTANYFPQDVRLPDFDFTGNSPANAVNYVRNQLSGDFGLMETSVETNQPYVYNTLGLGGQTSSASQGSLGWARPFGAQDGGATSGIMITPLWGERVAYGASQDGLRLLRMQHREAAARQAAAAYRLDGTPFTIGDYAVNPTTSSIYESADRLAALSDLAQVGGSVPVFPATSFVAANNLEPYYEAAGGGSGSSILDAFETQDFAHSTRFLVYPMALAYLMDDVLAKDCLRMEAECGLAHASVYTSTSGGVGSIKRFRDFLGAPGSATEGLGIDHSRVEAWIEFAISAAHGLALGDADGTTFRTTADIWANDMLGEIERGRTTTVSDRSLGLPTSVLYSDDSNSSKPLTSCCQSTNCVNGISASSSCQILGSPRTRDRLNFQAGYVHNGIRSMRQAFDVDVLPGGGLMDDMLFELANGMVGELIWDEGACTPHNAQAVSTYDDTSGTVVRELYAYDPDVPGPILIGSLPLPACSETNGCSTPNPTDEVTLSAMIGFQSSPSTMTRNHFLSRARGAVHATLNALGTNFYCDAVGFAGSDATLQDLAGGLAAALESGGNVDPFSVVAARASAFSMRSALLGLAQELSN